MVLRNSYTKFKNNWKYNIKLNTNLSSGYREKTVISSKLVFYFKFKKLIYNLKWKSGRNTITGKVILRTKKSLKYKYNRFKLNYFYRLLNLTFVANIVLLPYTLKIISVLFLSNGSVTFIQTALNTKLFNFIKFYPIKLNITKFYSTLYSINPKLIIIQGFFLIKQLPRNYLISQLEIFPNKGIQYVRGPGTFTKIIQVNFKLNIVFLKLPSGVKKFFSLFSLGSIGLNLLKEGKNFKNNKAGFYNIRGKKSITRGVAKNPIDHPHGGRTKAIKYQRTPWGKTTKFK